MKKSTTKRTPKQPHRYFLMPTTGDEALSNRFCSRIVIFKHGKEKGVSMFSDGDRGPAWWNLDEMETLGCVEIPAALVKRIAKV